ncbi:MAG: glucose-6-phosphate dehydrogenase assembly protein OpcA [Acidobacteria bacterium]|nr:glucose-6-phosphate dehydrogenase assembly protein OpcA [Acidobacteriota bacterium]
MTATIQPERILRELADLWVSLAQEHEPSTGVLRACAMTLVVLAEAEEDPAGVGETLAALMRDHPSRAIVVRVDGAGQPLSARVLAQCWMPFGSRQQICCEQIEISATEQALTEVAAVVLPLTAADLPVILWCRIPRLVASPGFSEFARLATKTIVDSAAAPDPRIALRQVAGLIAGGQLLADLPWTRLTRWRELIAQVFENPVYFAHLSAISEVKIVHAGAAAPVSAWYLAAWLRNCLEKAGSRPRIGFETTSDRIAGNLGHVELFAPDFHLSLGRVDGSAAEIRVNSLVSRTVFAKPNEYEQLREELSISGRDPVFEESLALAAKLVIEEPGPHP